MVTDSLSGCIEDYYYNKMGANKLNQKTVFLEKAVQNALGKLCLKKQRLSEDILSAEKGETYRLFGELLTANLHLLEQGKEAATVTNYYDGQPITIPLDKRLTPAKNTQNYYKKYSKSKTAIKEKTIRLKENDLAIAYLESVYSYIENASSPEDIEALRTELEDEGYIRARPKQKQSKKTKENHKPYTYKTESGLKVMAGRNNKENDFLTFKSAARTDIWFHAKGIPGSHVILYTGSAAPTDADIQGAARIAAFHSKGKQSENVPVDYTLVKYVKKPAGAKPGMVIFTNNKTLHVNPTV